MTRRQKGRPSGRRYKGRPSGKTIARDLPFIVEIAMPAGGLGKRLNAMHAFHNQRGIHVADIPRYTAHVRLRSVSLDLGPTRYLDNGAVKHTTSPG